MTNLSASEFNKDSLNSEANNTNMFAVSPENLLQNDDDFMENKGNILDDPRIMKSDLLALLNTPQGRRFLRRMLRACGVFDYIPVGDAALYAWHEGRRSVGLIIYHQVFELGANFINQLLGEDRNNV